eukprot:772425-Amphidinium_carterae.1
MRLTRATARVCAWAFVHAHLLQVARLSALLQAATAAEKQITFGWTPSKPPLDNTLKMKVCRGAATE